MANRDLTFTATIHKLGINPCVDVPEEIVAALLHAAQKKNAPVQVKCDLFGTLFDANVVRYAGNWRLYLNTTARKSAQKAVGDSIAITLSYDPNVRMPPMPQAFRQALKDDAEALRLWRLRPSPKRHEMLQFLNEKANDAELASGIAETLKRLLKRP
jgi:Domain of unknown function (DUF1905)